jgi:probable rRNA maturation factor
VTIELRTTFPTDGRAARRLRKRGRQFLDQLGRPEAALSVLLVRDAEIRRLNRHWRKKDRATDVLSFPISDQSGNGALLGDVVISVETAARRARRGRFSIDEELDRYLAHGVLHLLGYDHEQAADAREMAEKEAELTGAAGLVGAAFLSSGGRSRSPGKKGERAPTRRGSSRGGKGRRSRESDDGSIR